MRRPSRKSLALLIAVALLGCIAGVWFSARSTSNPRLSVIYMGTIDGKGHWRLRFAITNVGDRTLFTSKHGEIEVFNQTNLLSVAATAPMSKLAPGQGHVVDTVLWEAQMDSLDGKWSYTCLYGPDELRSRIYQRQWGSNGPGARVNWLIPEKLRGMPLTV